MRPGKLPSGWLVVIVVVMMGPSSISWLSGVRTMLVAVAEGFAGGRAGGEHEVGSVDSPTGGAVDDHRFGFDPSLGVDEHHAALVRREAGVAPPGKDDDDRTKRA